jgi:hypothetical protein
LDRAAVVVLVMLLGLSLTAVAIAQSDDGLDQETLDALRSEIPEGFPGERDLTEADAEFRQLVSIYGQSTAVPDFGDGSSLTGTCGGYAYSFGEDGELIDAAVDFGTSDPPVDVLDGGQAFTSSNPFEVDTRGLVQYYGFFPESGDGPEEHNWYIKTGGVSLDKGGDPNTNLNNRNAGIVDLAEDLPVKFTAEVRVEGKMTTQNIGTCEGKGHVKFLGNGLGDPVGLVGLALLGGGFFGLLFNSRPAYTYKG